MTKYIPKKITSAGDAFQRFKALQGYWSPESRLTQLIIIYIAELLEKILKQKEKVIIINMMANSAQVVATKELDNEQ